jgi:hypoxanthine phosphoribosyltransferase
MTVGKTPPDVLFPQAEIAKRIAEVGAEIAKAFEGREVCVVSLMKSCLVFLADIIRAIPRELSVHLLFVETRPGAGTELPRTEFLYSQPIPYAGQDVLLLDDVIDTGITLSYLLGHIREHHPRSVRVCALIDKPQARKVDVRADWSLFTLPPGSEDQFLVGYGLDSEESYRGLPYIGTIPRQRARAPESVR